MLSPVSEVKQLPLLFELLLLLPPCCDHCHSPCCDTAAATFSGLRDLSNTSTNAPGNDFAGMIQAKDGLVSEAISVKKNKALYIAVAVCSAADSCL